MAYDVSTGLSRGASGAAAGAQVGGPIGAAIGGGLGLVSGFFSGDDGPSDELKRGNRELYEMLRERFQSVRGQDPTQTTLFQTAVGASQDRAERQAEVDASQAAARGLTGSQFEVAQDQARAQQMARTQRRALRTADEQQRRREQSALQALLSQRSNLNAVLGAEADREQRRAQTAGQAVGRATSLFTSGEGPPPLQDELENFFGLSGGAPSGQPVTTGGGTLA